MLVAAFVSFCSMMLLMQHLSLKQKLMLVKHLGKVDVLLHGTIIYMFMGTSTDGLLQAEAAGIMFSLSLRGYRMWLRTKGHNV